MAEGADELESALRNLEELHGRSFAWSLACCRGRRDEAEGVRSHQAEIGLTAAQRDAIIAEL